MMAAINVNYDKVLSLSSLSCYGEDIRYNGIYLSLSTTLSLTLSVKVMLVKMMRWLEMLPLTLGLQ